MNLRTSSPIDGTAIRVIGVGAGDIKTGIGKFDDVKLGDKYYRRKTGNLLLSQPGL